MIILLTSGLSHNSIAEGKTIQEQTDEMFKEQVDKLEKKLNLSREKLSEFKEIAKIEHKKVNKKIKSKTMEEIKKDIQSSVKSMENRFKHGKHGHRNDRHKPESDKFKQMASKKMRNAK